MLVALLFECVVEVEGDITKGDHMKVALVAQAPLSFRVLNATSTKPQFRKRTTCARRPVGEMESKYSYEKKAEQQARSIVAYVKVLRMKPHQLPPAH